MTGPPGTRDLEWAVVRTGDQAQQDRLRDVVLDKRYRLVEQIARGGMATVYRALDERLDRWVAVKVMHAMFADDPDFVARFSREARSAAQLSSPEVVAVYDQGHDTAIGVVYLVMELVLGRDLRALMSERGALPPDRALSVIEPVLSALAAAHSAGIVHRDVKPENVLLGDDGRIKVADFGLARAVEASSVTATAGLIIGTVAYLAPEQIEHGLSEPRTDVYAAGILLWEMLVGQAPVTGDTPVAVLFSHVNRDVPPPSEQVPGLAPALDDLVVRATSRDPARRPLDAGAFLAEVRALRGQTGAAPNPTQAVVRDQTLVVPRQHTTAMPPRREDPEPARRGLLARRRRGLLAALLVLVLGVGAGVGGWWFTSGRYTDAPNVLELGQQQATNILREAGFSVQIDPDPQFDNSGTIPEGAVLDQEPDPGDRVRKNGTITLTISAGRDLRTIPTVVGLSQSKAVAALKAAGLMRGSVRGEFSEAPRGTVIDSDPAAGKQLLPGKSVSLVLSRGVEQLLVPTDLVGLIQAEAAARVKTADFVPQTKEVFSETVPAGRVVSTSPSSGRAGRGSTITLAISQGPKPRIIPDGIVGAPADEAIRTLEKLELEVQVLGFNTGGRVLDVRPNEGSTVERGETVTLLVF